MKRNKHHVVGILCARRRRRMIARAANLRVCTGHGCVWCSLGSANTCTCILWLRTRQSDLVCSCSEAPALSPFDRRTFRRLRNTEPNSHFELSTKKKKPKRIRRQQ